jgi:hypothetical protein
MTTKKKAKVKIKITRAKIRGSVPLVEGKHLVLADDVAFEVHGPLPPEVHPLPIPVEFEADLDKYSAGPAIVPDDSEAGHSRLWGWIAVGITVLLIGAFWAFWATH